MLEASAGTGKTFTIAALATRYVAEGLAELRRADAGHLRPGGDPGAARAGARAAGQRRARARRPGTGGTAAMTTTCCGCSPTRRTTRSRGAGAGWRPRSPTSTRRRIDHHARVLPADAARARHRRRQRARRDASSRTSTTWSSRSSTTSTLRKFGRPDSVEPALTLRRRASTPCRRPSRTAQAALAPAAG